MPEIIQGHPLSPPLLDMVLKILADAIRKNTVREQKAENKG